MADELVSQDRWQAGADYLASLRTLGLNPDALLWAQHDERKEMMLFLVSPIVDRVGSSEIYDTLFKAYDRAVTPTSIDPWLVSVVSPLSIISTEFQEMLRMDVSLQMKSQGLDPLRIDNEVFFGVADGQYNFRRSWVYFIKPHRMESKHQLKVWQKFQHNVDRAAA